MNETLQKAVIRLLKPLVRLLLRSGIGFATFAEWVKLIYVDVAESEFPGPNGKQSGSRISTLTGLHRKDVAKIRAELAGKSDSTKGAPPANRAQRVTNAWMRHPDYIDGNGLPQIIPIKGAAPSFYELVKLASGDIYPTAILDELLLADIVTLLDDDRIKMKKTGYVPKNNEEKLKILGQTGYELLSTLEHNVNTETIEPYMQMTVAYNHLSPDVVEKFKKLSRRDSTKLLMKLNQWLSEHDGLASSGDSSKSDKRAGIGIYYFEEDRGSNNEN